MEEEETFSLVGTPFVVILFHLRKKFCDSFESDFSDKLRDKLRDREKSDREKREGGSKKRELQL